MKITFYYHSCFLIELSSCYLLFDAYREMPDIADDKPLYVFASHAHADHFHPAVFTYHERKHPVVFILSADIETPSFLKVIGLKPYEEYHDSVVSVKTLRSTDAGVAFLVEAEGERFYFAGDLNWWDWGEEDSEEEAVEMERLYRAEMKRLEGLCFDAAFVPIDPRLKTGYWKGALVFLETCCVRRLFPMHCWKEFSIIEKACQRKELLPYRGCIQRIYRENECFLLPSKENAKRSGNNG